ncbi:MAG: hypothetical protein WBJ62_03480 [Coriobacteriia bacterium]|jgi:vacuolar-type H+-ATPase subunit H
MAEAEVGLVEKLERILYAEEDARDRVEVAREYAVELEREAAASASRIRQATLDQAREEARVAAAALIDGARDESAAFERQAAIERAAFIEAASARIDQAVAAALRELAG